MGGIRITLSTCCRNRADHVKQTFLKNMEDNQQDFVRFQLLNYNSQDELDEWAREHLGKYIASGRVVYLHEKTAERFKHAHARNVAIRACTTEVICNVDADNFTGKGFGQWLRQVYLDNDPAPVFTAYGVDRGAPCGDLFGRISFQVPHVVALGGYSEDLNFWGVEDWDIIQRAERSGFQRITYPKQFDTKPVEHSHDSRVSGTEFKTPQEASQKSNERQLGRYGMVDVANAKGRWGTATVEVNWKKSFELPLSARESVI
jgi:hypothetical protein